MAEDTQRFSDGTAYDQFMGRWTRAVGTIFPDWLAPPTDARWLDIGCGTGVFTDLIVNTCSPATVAAIDPSEPQIEIARKKPIAERADFRIADAQKLPFSDKPSMSSFLLLRSTSFRIHLRHLVKCVAFVTRMV
jgi:ubiquinone/menaquinone biosynthesis C-methylase UbiE